MPILVKGYNAEFPKLLDYAEEKFVSSFYNVPQPPHGSSALTSQWSINNSLVPQYQMSVMDEIELTKRPYLANTRLVTVSRQ